ncbi:LysM peptidoglycan-binding domain-containing protein [uncultured Microscilla sp.]|uniref:LysM peptidoglycan-binding domain-containing protein n=1 Tax=uncultured Microscilla sp. TaxID=432653 RepID=UPI0026060684|nr:LysM peptidoglycan-binding domain-containing protein [uncultured Microscilla sp.]
MQDKIQPENSQQQAQNEQQPVQKKPKASQPKGGIIAKQRPIVRDSKPTIQAKHSPIVRERKPTIQAKQRPVSKGQTKLPTIHTVKKGDTYSMMAQKYGVTVEKLRAWNGFADNAIPIGAQLLVSDPMKMTNEELQNYLDNFDLNKYLSQMGAPSIGDSSNAKQPDKTDPSVVGGYTQRGQVPLDFRGKQFYDHEGKPISVQDFVVNSLDKKNLKSAGGIGSGILSTKDYLKRQRYIAKVGKAAQEYLKRFDAELTSKGKWDIMKQANASRNVNRPLARQGLSFGGKNLSKALDQPRDLVYLLSKYQQQNPQMSQDQLARLIVQKSGTTSSSLLKFNKISRIAGPVGIVTGFGIAAYNIYDEPTLETVTGELMAMLGGATGMSLGMGIVAAGLAVAGSLPAMAIIAGAAVGGMALGIVTATIGKAIGREVGKWLDGLFD